MPTAYLTIFKALVGKCNVQRNLHLSAEQSWRTSYWNCFVFWVHIFQPSNAQAVNNQLIMLLYMKSIHGYLPRAPSWASETTECILWGTGTFQFQMEWCVLTTAMGLCIQQQVTTLLSVSVLNLWLKSFGTSSRWGINEINKNKCIHLNICFFSLRIKEDYRIKKQCNKQCNKTGLQLQF